MWNPFKKSPLLSEENEDFQIETYKWLLQNFGGKQFYESKELILPTEAFFPVKNDRSDKSVRQLFELVKKYAGLSNWPCKLHKQEIDAEHRVAELLTIKNVEENPLGTFSLDENYEAVITYNPKLAANPMQMVATISHELAHYLTNTAMEPPPGGWDNWEFATDIAATFLGFGIFQANSAFNFYQFNEAGIQGWQTSGGGYLSEAEHSYALAIFLRLKDIPLETAYPYCDTNIKAYLKKALKELDKSQHIETLKNVKFVGTGF